MEKDPMYIDSMPYLGEIKRLNRRVSKVHSIEKENGLSNPQVKFYKISADVGVSSFPVSLCTDGMNLVKNGDYIVYMLEGLNYVSRLENLEGNVLYPNSD